MTNLTYGKSKKLKTVTKTMLGKVHTFVEYEVVEKNHFFGMKVLIPKNEIKNHLKRK